MQSRFCWFTPILPKVKELFSSNKSGSSRFFLSHRIPASRAHRYPFVHLLVGGIAPLFHAVLRPAAVLSFPKGRFFCKTYILYTSIISCVFPAKISLLPRSARSEQRTLRSWNQRPNRFSSCWFILSAVPFPHRIPVPHKCRLFRQLLHIRKITQIYF